MYVCMYTPGKFVTKTSSHRLDDRDSIPHKVQVCFPSCSVQTGFWGILDITSNTGVLISP